MGWITHITILCLGMAQVRSRSVQPTHHHGHHSNEHHSHEHEHSHEQHSQHSHENGNDLPPRRHHVDPCREPPVRGKCHAYFEAWYYEAETGMCQPFVYSGCGGNTNRFLLRHQCEQRCSHAMNMHVREYNCYDEPQSGPCDASLQRWYYDQHTRQCQEFFYRGCGGNFNRYTTLASCEQHCMAGPPPLLPGEAPLPDAPPPPPLADLQECPVVECIANRCINGYVRDENGCIDMACECYICMQPVCNEPCPHGFLMDEHGCDTCSCAAPNDVVHCTELTCDHECHFGKLPDQHGCPTCDCRVQPPDCDVMACFIGCEWGHVVDDHGCRTCDCKPPPDDSCVVETCLMNCEYGFQKDENNCQICLCNAPNSAHSHYSDHLTSCPDTMCAMLCEFGFLQDDAGCDICECRPTQCPLAMCMMYCEHGFVLDDNGCELCECNAAPHTGECLLEPCTLQCAHGLVQSPEDGCLICECDVARPHSCHEAECLLVCDAGYLYDDLGCPLCQCAPSPDQGVMCPPSCNMYCPYGLMVDHRGCQLCQCNTPHDICPKRPCDLDCGDLGFRQDTYGCDMCECRSDQCSPVMCAMYCPFGFTKDEFGCDVCECSECAPIDCESECGGDDFSYHEIENGCTECVCEGDSNESHDHGSHECSDHFCFMHCPYGFVEDNEGCPVCECKPNDVCSPIMCAMYCPHGFRFDDLGCALCSCAEPALLVANMVHPQCPEPDCDMQCDHGYVQDEYGCQVCECKEPNAAGQCPDHVCMMHCENGFVQDAAGCSLCECIEEPVCPLTGCYMFCPYGFVETPDGCDTCQCKPPPGYMAPPPPAATCSPVTCRKYCPHGFMKTPDMCDVCECYFPPPDDEPELFIYFDDDADSGLPDGCSPVMCMMFCEFGFMKDPSGCDVCRCYWPDEFMHHISHDHSSEEHK